MSSGEIPYYYEMFTMGSLSLPLPDEMCVCVGREGRINFYTPQTQDGYPMAYVVVHTH